MDPFGAPHVLERSLAGRTGRALTVSVLISEGHLNGVPASAARGVMIADERDTALLRMAEPG